MSMLAASLEDTREEIVAEVSPNDSMYNSDPGRYFMLGRAALRNIRLALLSARRDAVETILDLPCGHGRVLRTLRAAYADAAITACDLDRDGVDFCAQTLGAEPVYSKIDPGDVELPGNYDLIWCGSLLTHIDAPRVDGFLDLFRRSLAPHGVVVFTTHGETVAERVRQRNPGAFGLDPEQTDRLLDDYERTGFAYQDYRAEPGYGTTLSSPAWICARLERFPDLRMVTYAERAWGSQDVVAGVRV